VDNYSLALRTKVDGVRLNSSAFIKEKPFPKTQTALQIPFGICILFIFYIFLECVDTSYLKRSLWNISSKTLELTVVITILYSCSFTQNCSFGPLGEATGTKLGFVSK
jgi:hypothetical protein